MFALEEPAVSPDDADSNVCTHRLGHQCRRCRAIRKMGPKEPTNPLARLIGPSLGITEATPADARAARYVQGQLRKRARRSLEQRGYRGLLNAIAKAA